MDDPYHNNVNQQMTEGGDYTYTQDGGGQDGYPYQTDYPPQDEDAASDATEGADEDDQMYEGEYQGIPHPDEIKEARRAARVEARRKARMAAQEEEEEESLPEQYETIMEDCGHGRFQWMLFFVLGLALMADGVDGFVVGFVLPSAEKDMCISNADKGLLGEFNWISIKFYADQGLFRAKSNQQLGQGNISNVDVVKWEKLRSQMWDIVNIKCIRSLFEPLMIKNCF